MAAGVAALLPQSALLGGGGLTWLNRVAGPGGYDLTDRLFQFLLFGATGLGLPLIGIVCGIHFMRLGGSKVIGVSFVVAGPVVSVLSLLARVT
jgi:hypothetical protein